MRLAEAWRVAVTALRANRLRSLLTMLGVVIGVAAVVVLVAIGTGAQAGGRGAGQRPRRQPRHRRARARLEFGAAPTKSRLELGRRRPDRRGPTGQDGRGHPVQRRDGPLRQQRAPSRPSTARTRRCPRCSYGRSQRGEYLRESDVDTRRRVAVVGSGLVDVAVRGRRPARPHDQPSAACASASSASSSRSAAAASARDRDSEVHIPVTAAQRLFGDMRVDALALKAPSTETHRRGRATRRWRCWPTATPTRSSARSRRTRSSAPSGGSSACSPRCWPPSPRSACSSAASASATSCW